MTVQHYGHTSKGKVTASKPFKYGPLARSDARVPNAFRTMPSFRYEATDALGKIVRGTIDADTERGARNQLRGRGLLPLSTAPAARAEGLGDSLRARLSDAVLA